ncbi:tape measure protein [Enterobacter hormaechei]|uniref:tape measure protein n=1 Tax=Enterobacter hormaechei TaxID=158836 RepID=UPI003966CA27
MVIREFLIRLGLTGSDSVGRGLDRVDGKVDKTIQSFNALGGVLATVFGAVTLSNIAKTADEMQSLEARIGMLPQTITTGAEAFDTVAQRASAARQGIEEYASFYIKAGNATQDFYKDQEQVLQLTDAVSIALAASGSTAVAQGQAFFQLGQAIGSPTVQMEEMNTLIDVAPDLFRALGKAIPGANNNLKAFISSGKVTGKMLAEGLIKVLPQL